MRDELYLHRIGTSPRRGHVVQVVGLIPENGLTGPAIVQTWCARCGKVTWTWGRWKGRTAELVAALMAS